MRAPTPIACTQTAARTIRPKIHKQLPEFLREFPPLPDAPPAKWADAPGLAQPDAVDWDALIADVLTRSAAWILLGLS